jgi:hypothetical protein
MDSRNSLERQELGLEQWTPRIIFRDSQTNVDLINSEFFVTLSGDSSAANRPVFGWTIQVSWPLSSFAKFQKLDIS